MLDIIPGSKVRRPNFLGFPFEVILPVPTTVQSAKFDLITSGLIPNIPWQQGRKFLL